MTVPELLQLYAPLAGMLAMAFWVGVLSERVRNLQTSVRKLEQASEGSEEDLIDITRLKVQVENFGKSIDKITRSMEGFQRQLANLMRGNVPQEFHVDS